MNRAELLPPVATIVEALSYRARMTPDSPAYIIGDEPITYAELHADVLRLAAVLGSAGIERGCRCALVLDTLVDLIRAMYAVQALGAAPAIFNTSLPDDVTLRRLVRMRPHLVLVAPDRRESLLRRAAGSRECLRIETIADLMRGAKVAGTPITRAEPDDIGFLQITSGTTGDSRAAMVPHRTLIAFFETAHEAIDFDPRDRLVSWLPLHHDFGLVLFGFAPVFFGLPVHLMEPSLGNLRRWLAMISNVRATITASPDFGYRIAARTVNPAGLDLRSLRCAISGGEPVRLSTITLFERRFGVPGVIRPGYGLAESTLGVTLLQPGELLRTGPSGAVTCGPAHGHAQIRIVDPEGRELPAGEAGEILIGGSIIFAGYFDDEAGTREVLRDGWLHTGDVGAVDDDGHLFVLGRMRALIKRAGAAIPPREVEEAVERVGNIRYSAAVGIADEAVGGTEAVVVVAEVRSRQLGAASASLVETIAREVRHALGFAPGRVLLVPPHTIPRTPNGKTRYDELRRLVRSGELDQRSIGSAVAAG